METYDYDAPGIVVSSIGARCGKAFHATGRWAALANTQVVLPDTRVADARFLWYQLNDERSWVRSGSAQPFIKPRDIASRSILVAALSEQRRIVEILDQADAIRRKRAEADRLAEHILPALFYQMFGDPVSNPKRWPTVSFDNAIEDVTADAEKLQRQDYAEAGLYPVIDQGQSCVAGYSDDESKVWRGSLPVVVFGDHTRVAKFVDVPFVAGADGSRVFQPRKGFNAAYLTVLLQLMPLPNLGYSRHMRVLKTMSFMKPPEPLLGRFSRLSRSVRSSVDMLTPTGRAVDDLTAALLHGAFSGELTAKWRKENRALVEKEMAKQKRLLAAASG